MKRYLIFAGDHAYPNGGFRDIVGNEDDVESATKVVEDLLEMDKCYAPRWWQIVDITTGEIVDEKAPHFYHNHTYLKKFEKGELVSIPRLDDFD